MSRSRRPTSVTVIAWFFAVSGGMSFVMTPLSFLFMPAMPEILEAQGQSVPAAMALGIVGSVVLLVSGVGMLRGRRWARRLCLVYMPGGTVVHVIALGFNPMMLLGPLFYIAPFWLLLRAPARAYFAGGPEAAPEPEETDAPLHPIGAAQRRPPVSLVKRTFGAVLIVLGSYVGVVLGLMVAMMGAASVAMSPTPWSRGSFSAMGPMVVVYLVLLTVAAGLLLGGVALWGWGRKRMVFGVVLTVVGACGGVAAASAAVAGLSPAFVAAINAQQPALEAGSIDSVMRPMIGGGLVACAIGLAGGVPLIRSQMKRDRRSREMPDEEGA
jgi:hypothetical protein